MDTQTDRSEIPPRRPELYRELQLQRYPWFQSQYYQIFAPHPLLQGSLFSVAVCSMEPEYREGHLANIKQAICQAGKRGNRLLILPELVLGGVPENLKQAQRIAIRAEPCRCNLGLCSGGEREALECSGMSV